MHDSGVVITSSSWPTSRAEGPPRQRPGPRIGRDAARGPPAAGRGRGLELAHLGTLGCPAPPRRRGRPGPRQGRCPAAPPGCARLQRRSPGGLAGLGECARTPHRLRSASSPCPVQVEAAPDRVLGHGQSPPVVRGRDAPGGRTAVCPRRGRSSGRACSTDTDLRPGSLVHQNAPRPRRLGLEHDAVRARERPRLGVPRGHPALLVDEPADLLHLGPPNAACRFVMR